MAISKSTPYVRYKKDFTSSLHLGTIHIESEYLDRTQKTTIESIHGMTWHNKVVNENKELNLLSDTQLELTDLEKQYWNTGEKCVSVDEIHTLEEVEPNEDGTYTYTVNSMEGEYIEIYNGINNITSTSDGLDGQFEIVYDTTEEDINGNIALDAVAPQYEITDSGVGIVTSAKSTGLTLVNHITESSKEEVVAIEQQEGRHFTIENTVQGNIKNATLKGQTLVNQSTTSELTFKSAWQGQNIEGNTLQSGKKYFVSFNLESDNSELALQARNGNSFVYHIQKGFTKGKNVLSFILEQDANGLRFQVGSDFNVKISNIIILEYQDGMENWDIPYFTGMQSVKMPALTTTGKNLFNKNNIIVDGYIVADGRVITQRNDNRNATDYIEVLPDTIYTMSGVKNSGIGAGNTAQYVAFYDKNKKYLTYAHVNVTSDEFSITTSSETIYIRMSVRNDDINRLQIEKGTIATTYEPYKSNILTCNEEVELRGIGDVKDELNCLTGEVVERVGEYQITGEENWRFESTHRRIEIENPTFIPNIKCGAFACDKLQAKQMNHDSLHGTNGTYYIGYTSDNWLRIILDEDLTSLEQGKEWLKANKPIIQYQLETESIKTVDLTVQNQDGGTIPHIQTQQGITHVSTSSDSLIPVVEMSCSYDTIIKPNTTYTIKLDRPIVSDTMYLQVDLGGTMMMLDADVNAFTIKTPSTLSHSQLRLSGTGNTVKEIIVLEGNRVNDKIGYFEGMKNVENPILVVSNCPFEGVTFKKYQSTTLSLNEPIQLRSIGDVHDEINYETGEYIQRIGEIVLDGSERWDKWGTSSFLYRGSIRVNATNNKILNDKLPIANYDDIYYCTTYGIGSQHGNIGVRINDVASVEDLIKFLSQNPTTVQYQLAQPIITKIDTTILDQNNSYKSSQQTYDEQTYVSVQSDTVVIPTSSVDYEIYSSIGTVTGTSATIENAEAGTPVSGVVYGETLLNVIQEPSEDEFVCIDSFEGQSGTLENTVEGNIKSAILKGQTLVNVLDIKASSTYLASKELTGFSFNAIQHSDEQMISTKGNYKKGSDYTLIFNSDHAFTLQTGYDMTNTGWKSYDIKIGRNIIKVTTLSDTSYDYIRLRTDSSLINHEKVTLSNFIILEGDYSLYSMDIPYFEGMESVTNPSVTVCGKNLAVNKPNTTQEYGGVVFTTDGNKFTMTGKNTGYFGYDFASQEVSSQLQTHNLLQSTIDFYSGKILVDEPGVYTVSALFKATDTSGLSASGLHISIRVHYDDNKALDISPSIASDTFYENGQKWLSKQFTVEKHINGIWLGLWYKEIDFSKFSVENIQLEKGSTATTYEQYRENTITCSEPISLHKIGDIQDELDLETGVLTQRIGEVVLDGSDDIVFDIKFNGVYEYVLDGLTSNMIITIPETLLENYSNPNYNGHYYLVGESQIRIIQHDCASISDFKQWLSQNPITIKYQLKTKSIKTVDLSILDQDNNSTTFHTYDTITYIKTSSDYLKPTLEITNPTYDVILKPNTEYTIKLNRTNIVDGTPLTVNLGGTELSIEDSTDSFTITTPSTLTNNTLSIGGANNKVKEVMVIEGDYVDRDLDFFEGFIHVENPIINIYHHDMDNINFYNIVKWEKGNEYSELCRLPIKGQTIWYKVSGSMWNYVKYYDKDKNYLGKETNQGMGGSYQLDNDLLKPELKSKAVYFSINKRGNPTNGGYPQLRTKNNKPDVPPTPLSEICRLMTYPQVTLRSIGDIKDEWDVVGETVTRRIGKIVFDGSENWNGSIQTDVTGGQGFRGHVYMSSLNLPNATSSNKVITDKTANNEWAEGIYIHPQQVIYYAIPNTVQVISTATDFKQYLQQNPITVQYELAAPITEPVRITPPNPQTSTASITIPTQLDHVEDMSDFLVWNPYKEHYVRYNYVEDGTVLDNYTWENLTDLNERQFVEFYNKRTYIDQPYHNYVASHDSKGTSKYVLIEPNQDYTVSVRFSELPTCETVKVNLGGAEVEMNVNDPHVHVTTPNTLANNLCSISGDGLDGKVTDILVIHCLEHEGFADIDYFEGIDGIGEIVEVDGAGKASIVMEQTNGNLIDEEFEVWNNGNYIRIPDNDRIILHPNKTYGVIFKRDMVKDIAYTLYVQLFDKNNKQTRIVSGGATKALNNFTFTTKQNEKYCRVYSSSIRGDGSVNKHFDCSLHLIEMSKDYIRPRYYDKEEILLPIQLHGINTVYDNFYYDEMKGYYRIQQSIGHKYFVGADSENWTLIERGQRVLRFRYNNADIQMKSLGEFMTNILPNGTATSPYESCTFNGTTFIVSIDKERLSSESLTAFKEWLTNNNLHLYYQLASPLMIDLPQYPNRIEFNTYKDEIYTFFKNCKPTVFTLAVPLDQTYRFYELEQGEGYANRVELTDERMTEEDTLYIDTIYGSGFSNLIENPNNVETLLKPNYQGKAVSHTLTNGKVSSIKVHGFEPNETTIANYNSTLKQYELIVQAQKGQNINTQTLAVPYKLEVYEDGTKDKVYYDEQNKVFRFEGGSVTNPPYNNSYIFNTPLEVFKGIAPRTGLIAEIKVKFNSGTTSARIYYSLDGGATTAYSTLRSMTDEVEYYIGFFNTGGTKLDYATKLSAEAEYTNLAPLSSTLPESLIITQIQNISECTFTLDKTYYFDSWIKPLELDVYNGETIITEQSGAIVTINNNGLHKDALTYTDETYTVYWTYVGGEGNVTITLGGTKVEVVGTQGYATLKTAIDGVQDGLIIGGYNLSIKDLMLVKGERIEDLAYFEGSRAVGTAFVDENGETKYKITLVTGSELINDKFENRITFEDNNKHNVVVTKLLGNKPNKK